MNTMKSTAERLSEVYCRPQTEEELSELMAASRASDSWNYWTNVDGCWLRSENGNLSVEHKTEIPVSVFIDLLHDRIVPWRLEDDGFKHTNDRVGGYVMQYSINDISVLIARYSGTNTDDPDIEIETEEGWVMFQGITTYTDLLTLIRLIG